jgi:hypothetical protein
MAAQSGADRRSPTDDRTTSNGLFRKRARPAERPGPLARFDPAQAMAAMTARIPAVSMAQSNGLPNRFGTNDWRNSSRKP